MIFASNNTQAFGNIVPSHLRRPADLDLDPLAADRPW